MPINEGDNMHFQYQKVLVIGLARSGKAAIGLLHKLGVNQIILTEIKEVEDQSFLNEMGVTFVKQSDEVFEDDYDLVIKNPGVPPVSPFIQKLKERSIPVWTEIELAFSVAKSQHYVAITGTNGKTTTTTLTYEIFKQAYGEKALVGGNIGTPLCELVLKHHLMEEEGYYIALEISNAQLVDIVTFKPEVSTIINLTPDHIDFMGGLDKYYESKTRVYENMDKEGLFIKNVDDNLVEEYTSHYPMPCLVQTVSLKRNDTDAYLKDGWMYFHGEACLELNKITLPGEHNLQNIMIASMACLKEGVSFKHIQDTIYQFKGVEHRIEFVRELDGVKYYNDSKGTNTDATITALKSFDKGVILLIGGFEKGLDMSVMLPYMGCVKQVIGYGACGKRIAHDLIGDDAIVVSGLQEAVIQAKQLAEPGDIVLLSPTTSSFDQYNNFEERGDHFKQIVNTL